MQAIKWRLCWHFSELVAEWQGASLHLSIHIHPLLLFILVCEAVGTAATPGLLCQPRVIVKMIVEKQMECRLAGEGKPKFSEKICPQRPFYPCFYSPLLDFRCFLSFLFFYTVGRTPWTGDQAVARPLSAHRTAQIRNKHTQTSMPQEGFEPTFPVFDRATRVHALDRAANVTGLLYTYIYIERERERDRQRESGASLCLITLSIKWVSERHPGPQNCPRNALSL
jgi:hypothetical protein